MCYDNEYRMNKSRREKIMKKRIVFATGNAGKMKEIKMILGDLGMPVVSMKEAGIEADIVEDGTSFAENAQIKASAIFEKCHDIVLADDSGLEIDYLNKEPGIYSARYMGEDTSYHIKNANLISRLEGVPDEKRTARFVCAIAQVLPNGEVLCTVKARSKESSDTKNRVRMALDMIRSFICHSMDVQRHSWSRM